MSTLKTNAILDADGGTTATVNGYTPTASNMAGRNRIINGNMAIDQRNAGASVTVTGSNYSVDRFLLQGTQSSKYTGQQNAGSVTPPAGFRNYLGTTSSSAYSILSTDIFVIQQPIEGYNAADLMWGTASAATIILSFWVRSSLTGTFGGSLTNDAPDRSYPFTYTISSANTWEQKTITIAGDTSGTWGTTNGVGIRVYLSLGTGSTKSGTAGIWAGADYRSATGATSVVGTSGATFYITGVQLEKGSTATDFEYRDYGRELSLCQRYYETCNGKFLVVLDNTALTRFSIQNPFLVVKRTEPTVVLINVRQYNSVVDLAVSTIPSFFSDGSANSFGTMTANLNQAQFARAAATFSAEL